MMEPSTGTPPDGISGEPNNAQVSMPATAATMDSFAEALKTDRMIKIHIGQNDYPPFLVPQSILCNASDYFLKAIKHERLGGGESGVLRFPADDLESWKIMLFWMFHAALPAEVQHPGDPEFLILSRGWILGDKYLMPQFQDLVMMEMLKLSEDCMWDLEAIKAVFAGTMPDTALRQLVAEEVVLGIREGRRMFEVSDMDGLNAVGVTSSLLTAVRILEVTSGVSSLADWRRYMVGSGPPAKHWIWEEED